MDIEKFRPVIDDILRKLKVSRDQQEDLRQDCYVELLMKQEQLEAADDSIKYAARLCKNHILSVWRDAKPHNVEAESLSDPKIGRKAAKISIFVPNLDEEMLQEALKLLPLEEFEVITLLYVEGQDRKNAAAALGVHPNTVDNRVKSGVAKLKQYFGVD